MKAEFQAMHDWLNDVAGRLDSDPFDHLAMTRSEQLGLVKIVRELVRERIRSKERASTEGDQK